MTDESPTKRAVLELQKVEGNNVCADCGRAGEKIVFSVAACFGGIVYYQDMLSVYITPLY